MIATTLYRVITGFPGDVVNLMFFVTLVVFVKGLQNDPVCAL